MLRRLRHYLDVLRRNPRPGRFIAARALVMSGLCRHWVIDQSRGYKLRFFPSNLSEQLWIDPTARDEPLAFFAEYLRPGDVVIDVGANIGDTCIVCARTVGPSGRVFAFEPHPRVYGWLAENVKLNGVGNAVLANIALGDSDGTVMFSDVRRDDMNRVMRNGSGLVVQVRQLDRVLPSIARIALLKIDVEGFEIFVLRGARATLASAECVHVEIGEKHFRKYDYDASEVLRTLEEAGFALMRFVSDRHLSPIDAAYVPARIENILGVRSSSLLHERLAGRGLTIESGVSDGRAG